MSRRAKSTQRTVGPKSAAPIRDSGFSPEQMQQLSRPLDSNHVHAREVGGKQLSYIEGWYALAQANEIFGYDGWDREMVYFERVHDRIRNDTTVAGYIARVRIKVWAGDIVNVYRERAAVGAGRRTTM